MIDVLLYKIHNRLLRMELLRKPIMDLEESCQSFIFQLSGLRRRELKENYLACDDFQSLFEFSCAVLGPHQKRGEIEKFIEFVSERQPKKALEIGVAAAGTTFLIRESMPSLNHVIGIDIHLHNIYKLEFFNKRDCALQFFEGDSKDKDIRSAVEVSLDGQKLDLLFIDGDHSYEGVKADFHNYKSLVNNGGIIAFHDICQDFKTRYGIGTPNYAGGVPQFWQEVKDEFEHFEFVEDVDQDGFGIGCLVYRPGLST